MNEMHVTHYGRFAGLAPIKLDFTDPWCPVTESRWPWLDWWFSIVEVLFEVYCGIATYINPDFIPMFPIEITEVVNWDREPIEDILGGK